MWQDLCGLSEPWFGGSEYRIPEPSTPRRIDADTSNVTLQALANAENDQYFIAVPTSEINFIGRFVLAWASQIRSFLPIVAFSHAQEVIGWAWAVNMGVTVQSMWQCARTLNYDHAGLLSHFGHPVSSLTVQDSQDYKYELETFRAFPVHQFIG